MDNVQVVIIKNQRLDFQESERKVSEFIQKRLEYFGFNKVSFIEKDQLEVSIDKYINDNFVIVVDIMNPILDIDLINKMLQCLSDSKMNCITQEGAIPGTQVEYILAPGNNSYSEKNIMIRWNTQNEYNNQLNLYKYKRLKMFLYILNNLNDCHTFNITEFMQHLSEDELFEKLASFGEDIRIYTYEKCPHCSGELSALPMTMSQPFCGYLPTNRPLYHECAECGLVVMSPFVDGKETFKIYDNFDKQDFVVSLNNPYHKGAIRCDFSSFEKNIPKNARTLDLGGGMGMFSKYLKETYPDWKVTHSDFEIKRNVDLEKLNIVTRSLNFIEESIGDESYDFITAWEVIEHIPYEKLDTVLNNIYKSLSKGGVFMFSTPDFDSPLCRSNDFFAVCPPFHYLVFGKKWLEKYFEGEMWEIKSTRYCSDFLDDSNMWYDYVQNTAPSFQQKSTGKILKLLLSKDENKKLLLDNGMGTEIIFVLVKR